MSRSRAKGTRWETAVVEFLRANGHPHCERRAMRGHNDGGDLAGIVGWVLECKATRELDVAGAVDEAQKELENERIAPGRGWCAAILKRRRRGVAQAYVVMELQQFARLLSDNDS